MARYCALGRQLQSADDFDVDDPDPQALTSAMALLAEMDKLKAEMAALPKNQYGPRLAARFRNNSDVAGASALI